MGSKRQRFDLLDGALADHRREPPASGGGDQRPCGSVRADGTKHLTYSELMVGRDGRGLSAVRVFTVTARVARQPLPAARQHAFAHRRRSYDRRQFRRSYRRSSSSVVPSVRPPSSSFVICADRRERPGDDTNHAPHLWGGFDDHNPAPVPTCRRPRLLPRTSRNHLAQSPQWQDSEIPRSLAIVATGCRRSWCAAGRSRWGRIERVGGHRPDPFDKRRGTVGVWPRCCSMGPRWSRTRRARCADGQAAGTPRRASATDRDGRHSW